LQQTLERNLIPQELIDRKQWILWRLEYRSNQDKPTKVPYQINGKKASSTDSATWTSHNTALKVYQDTNKYSGIGYVLSDDDPYVIIDLDDCFDGNRQLIGKNKEIVDSIASYTEISQSGNGLHIVVKGENIKGFNNRKESIEMYSQARFFAMTGDVYEDFTTIDDNNVIVQYLHDTYNTGSSKEHTEIVEDQPQNHSDDELVNKIRNSKQSEKFSSLYDKGDISNYDSDSEADYGLACILAWWTKNANQIERLMRGSALYRDKWDEHSDYLRGRTIQNALQTVKGGYKASDEFQVHVKDSETIDLKSELKSRRFEEKAAMESQWIEEGKQGRKPVNISPVRCAVVLMEYVSFILFDLEENTRVAMYLPEEGIYTRNTTLIKRVISWLEPKHNSNKADEVIYHLTNMADVKEKTESRYLVPVENGIFNLKTKTLEPFSPDNVFTTKISTRYVDQPEKPVIDGWDIDAWLNSIACGDSEIVHLLWQVINDSLNGNYSRKKAIFLVGGGNNGKGTFQQLITNLIGLKNMATLKVNEFDLQFRLSVLEGKTAVIGDDVPANVYIDDSSNFNSVVTGDVVSVEFKNKQPYNTIFNCSVIQSTNDMPKFKNKTDGTIRRLVIVPFKANFNGEIENPKIKEEYINDEKVLQYVLYKAINMDFEKFDIPEASKQEMEVFKQDNDPILDFKRSVFDTWKTQKVPMYVVYGFYKIFCNENGYKYAADRQFHKQFKTYLGDDWESGKPKKYNYEDLFEKFGDLDVMGIGFPEKNVNQRSYVNEGMKII